MLRSLKHLFGEKLRATDGEIGQVKDLYFDDQNWAVRYVVANTGAWLPGRQIFLVPHSICHPIREDENFLRVNLTRNLIERSPFFDSHKLVSRQSESQYYNYCGWPYYWQGGGLWSMSGLPVMGPVATVPSVKAKTMKVSEAPNPAAHLRSAEAVTGYHLRATEGIIGYVCDLVFDDHSWAIRQLVIKTGHRLFGAEVQIPTEQVARISWDDSTVFVNMTKDEVEHGPGHVLAQDPATVAVLRSLGPDG